MKKSVVTILGDAQNKMSGYVALLNYRYSNLSVLAQAEALLCVFVDLDGDRIPIEKVAKARNAPGCPAGFGDIDGQSTHS